MGIPSLKCVRKREGNRAETREAERERVDVGGAEKKRDLDYYKCMYVCVCFHVCVCMYGCMFACMNNCMYACVHACVCLHFLLPGQRH